MVFADSGISAANGDHRPGYAALRDAITRGQIAHVWCVEQSRLERQEIGWFVLAAELADAGISELHTNRDGIVRVGDDAAGIKAVLNAGEVRRLRRRVNDALDQIAAEGRPGGAHPYGYRNVWNERGEAVLEVVPEQAEVIKWAAGRILAGWSLNAVAAELAARGVPTRHGGRWSHKKRPQDARRPHGRGLPRLPGRGSYAFRAVDVATGDTIDGTVRNMRHAAEDEARRLGYEVVNT